MKLNIWVVFWLFFAVLNIIFAATATSAVWFMLNITTAALCVYWARCSSRTGRF